VAALEVDPGDRLAVALAKLGRAMEARETEGVTGVHGLPGNTTQS
jgi:hypothetical protein